MSSALPNNQCLFAVLAAAGSLLAPVSSPSLAAPSSIHHDVNQVAMKCVLGDRFLRLDSSIAHSPMDDVTLIPAWIEAANKFVDAPENQEMFDILAARLVSAGVR